MNTFISNSKPKFYSGWRSALFRMKFGVSSCKYILQRNKYPLFLINSLKLKKTQGLQEKIKVVKFNNRYYGSILRLPGWPSKPFDHMVASGGLNICASGTSLKQQIDSVILGITRKCNYGCKHCYENPNLSGKESVSIKRWKEVVKDLQKLGVSIVVLSGGEPMLRYEGLIELLESGEKDFSDFHIHTSGNGVSKEKALELKKAGLTAAGIALDDFNPCRQDELRSFRGSHQESVRAIQYFREAGVFPYVNICLNKDLIRSGGLWEYLEYVNNLNVGFINLIEPKPWGGFYSEKADDLFNEEDRRITTEFFDEVRFSRKYDGYPLIFYIQYFEGLSHFSINSKGDVQACVFLPVSFGNVLEEDLREIYKKMREAIPAPLHKMCPSLYLEETIKIKKNQGAKLPIPYGAIEKEWEQMYA
jgi:MoaA/NifB/PqqE/SkfB family radical SAM enzyme